MTKPNATDHGDERLRGIAAKIRKLVFAEFGHPSTLSSQEIDELLRTMMALHCGELIEIAARFRREDLSIRDFIMTLCDRFIETNTKEIAEVEGRNDPRDYLEGTP